MLLLDLLKQMPWYRIIRNLSRIADQDGFGDLRNFEVNLRVKHFGGNVCLGPERYFCYQRVRPPAH